MAVQLTLDRISYNAHTTTLSAKMASDLHESVPLWIVDERTNMRDTGFLSYGEYKRMVVITNTSKFSTIFTDLSSSADSY